MTASDLIGEYYAARENYEELKKLSDQAYGRMRSAEYKLVDAMLDEGTAGMKRDDGTNVVLKKHFGCSVTIENQELIRQWLVETEGDDSPFTEEKLSKAAVSELIKKKIEEEHIPEDEFPEFLKVNTRPGIAVQGWKTRLKE